MIRALRAAYREGFSGLPGSVWLIAAVAFVNRSGTMVLPFLALYLCDVKGLSVTEAGTLLSLYGIGAMGGAYMGGWLSDHVGPRRVMAFSLVLTGGGFFLLGTLDHLAAIACALLALSLVGEAFRPATASAITTAAPPGDRARALALARLAVNLGMTFGPAAGGFLAARSYTWLFVADGGTCLLAAGFLVATLRGEDVAGAFTRATSGSDRSPWRDGTFLAAAALASLFAVAIFQLFGTWPLYLHTIDAFSEAAVGLLMSLNTIVIVLFQMPVLHLVRGRAPLPIAAAGAFLFCAGLAILPLAGAYAWALFTVLVWSAGELISLPLIEGFIAERADEATRGRYMGVYTLSFSVAFILAPLAGTWIWKRFGPPAVWWACGAVGVGLWAGLNALARSAGRSEAVAGAAPQTPAS